MKRWDFGDLPEEIALPERARNLPAIPHWLIDEGKVAIHLFDTREAAQASMRGGVRQLLRFELREQMKQLEKESVGAESLPGPGCLAITRPHQSRQLREDMLSAIADRAFIANDPLPRTEKEFAAQRQRARTRLPAVTEAFIRDRAEYRERMSGSS